MSAKEPPLSKLDPEKEKGFDYQEYPKGIATDEIPPYIIFYINEPETSKYAVTQNPNATVFAGGVPETAALAGAIIGPSAAQFVQGKAKRLGPLLGGAILGNAGKLVIGGSVLATAANIRLKPKYNRIRRAIKLYMPDTIAHTDSHDYDQVSLTQALGRLRTAQVGAETVGSVINSVANLDLLEVTGINIADKASNFGSALISNPSNIETITNLSRDSGITSGELTGVLLNSLGYAINPQLEMIYKKTNFRGFSYQFKFQPRSKNDSDTIKEIITTFRKYAAPQLADGNGLYLIPPAQFEIDYRFMGKQNEYIGKIKSCVLESVDVDYSSAGQFAVFEETGAPVQIGLILRFREIEIITKDQVELGY